MLENEASKPTTEEDALDNEDAPYYTTFEREPPLQPAGTSWTDYLPSSHWLPKASWLPSLPSMETVKNILPSWSSLAYGAAAVATTLPFIPYCFTSTPESISRDWWFSLSSEQQIFLLSNALIYFLVGTATRTKYYQVMVQNLSKIMSSYLESLGSFTYNSMIIIVSAISAAPSAALGYFGSVWAGTFIASASSIASFINTWALRIVFIPNFITSVKNHFDADRVFQKNIQFDLALLHQEHQKEADHWIKENFASKELHEGEILSILHYLYDKACSVCQLEQSIFRQQTLREQITQYLKSGADLGISAILSASFFILISQAGFEGFKLACRALFEHCSLDTMAYLGKIAISLTPGITASIVAFMAGHDFFHQTIKDVVRHAKEKPKDILKTAIITGCCFITAFAMLNAAKSIADKPNLYHLKLHADYFWDVLYRTVYLYGNYTVGIALDLNACLKLFNLNDISDPEPSINNVKIWLNTQTLSKEGIAGLRAHGFFALSETKKPRELTTLVAQTSPEPV